MAFLLGKKAHAARSSTDGQKVFLHGHCIAERTVCYEEYPATHDIWFSFCGWPTVTTRDRINGILSILGYNRLGVSQRQGEQWLVFDAKKVMKLDESGVAFNTNLLDRVMEEMA